MTYSYRKATMDDLERIWAKTIAEHKGGPRWIEWKDIVIENNKSGKCLTFVIVCDDEPIGEGTLIFSPDCTFINDRTELSDNKVVANVNALRIQKNHEGKGHISKLMKEMELYAVQNGYSALTIGVEARETRNLAIYLHWGYTEFVLSEIEDGELVLYYKKELK